MLTAGVRGMTATVLGIMLLGSSAVFSHASSSATGLPVGAAAPQFIVQDINGTRIDLGRVTTSNKATVINFWGLRCGACLEEMPHLSEIYDKHKNNGLIVLGINVDGVSSDIIQAQLSKNESFPSYVIVPDEELKIADLYKLTAAPLTVVVDSNGKIVYTHEGYQKGDEIELESHVARLLK